MKSVSADLALKNAVASIRMEGYQLSESNIQMCRDVLSGKMTKAQCIEKILKKGVKV